MKGGCFFEAVSFVCCVVCHVLVVLLCFVWMSPSRWFGRFCGYCGAAVADGCAVWSVCFCCTCLL